MNLNLETNFFPHIDLYYNVMNGLLIPILSVPLACDVTDTITINIFYSVAHQLLQMPTLTSLKKLELIPCNFFDT